MLRKHRMNLNEVELTNARETEQFKNCIFNTTTADGQPHCQACSNWLCGRPKGCPFYKSVDEWEIDKNMVDYSGKEFFTVRRKTDNGK